MMYRSFIQKNESEGGDSTKVIALFDKTLNVAHPSAEVARQQSLQGDYRTSAGNFHAKSP